MTSLVPVIEVKQRATQERKAKLYFVTLPCGLCPRTLRFNAFFEEIIILMENQNTQQPSLCRAGCGFYGNSSNDGMCSKCFKDALRRTQSTSPTGRVSPATNSAPTIDESNSSTISNATSQERTTEDREQPAAESVEQGGPSTITDEPDQEDSPSKVKRKNRCATCRKKVGLTGFQCRCGGLFCSLHRYSDKHECSFDYKAEGQAEIRKNNPVVIRDKVQKI